MNIRKALGILGISTIDNNVLNTAKKRYRQLARKYHPDLTGNDKAATLKMEELNEAYETLKSTSQKIKAIADSKTDSRESIIISLGDLENIFMGKSVTIGDKIISKENIGRFRVFIDFDIKYSYLGIMNEKNVTQLRNTDDKYVIDISIMLEKSEAVDVEIRLHSKKIKFNLASGSVRLSLTYNCNISVTLIVNRKLIVSDKNN